MTDTRTPATIPLRLAGQSPTAPAPRGVDAGALAEELRRTVQGEVRFDAGSRALYTTDASNYRQVPIGVVIPRDADDVARTVDACRRHGAPVLPRGGGTSLAGQTCNVAVVIDASKYFNRLVELDAGGRVARVQPGIILDTLRDAAEQHHLTYGPDPATHSHCTLGGMIGNNSCGTHSLRAGMTSDNVETLEILTYDGLRMRVGPTSDDELARVIGEGGRRGEIYRRLQALRDRYAGQIRARFPDIPRRVSGYHLPALLPEHGFNVAQALVGSEGTCANILEATVRLLPSPPARALVVAGYPDIYTACDDVPRILDHKPIGLEGFDDRMIDAMTKKGQHLGDLKLLPRGKGWLLVEFGGERAQDSQDRARSFMDAMRQRHDGIDLKLYDDPGQQQLVWQVREAALRVTAYSPGSPDAWSGWEDSAVPPGRLGHYLRDLRALFERYNYDCSLYGHFGQGCAHVRVDFDLVTAAGIQKYVAFANEAADLVLRYGGSLSGERGDGQSRAQLLPKMFGGELMGAFREFKAIWDPQGKMNPGKLIDAYRIDENLRLGISYNPPAPATHFAYADDHGSFAHVVLRCVGVGNCRRLGSDEQNSNTMCPSFMVTREEKHSTRGRARMLFEMGVPAAAVAAQGDRAGALPPPGGDEAGRRTGGPRQARAGLPGVDLRLLRHGGRVWLRGRRPLRRVGEGERVLLLPAVRAASKETLVIADGFSCREQIRQGADRDALHLAQVIQLALHEDNSRQPVSADDEESGSAGPTARTVALAGAGVGVADLAAWRLLARRKR